METLTAFAAPEDAGTRLDLWLSQTFAAVSRSRAKALVLEGALSVDGARLIDPRAKVVPGAEYALSLPDTVPAVPEPEDLPLDILYEDEHLIVINKAAGMAVHPGAGTWSGTVVNALLHHCAGNLPGIGGVERPGIVHRLDKLTSGTMVVAKTDAAHQGLSAQFADHSLERLYLAITRGAPRPLSGTVDLRLQRSPTDRKKMAVVRDDGSEAGRHAVTHYRARATYGLLDKGAGLPAAALIECRLETGRTHQIRVHMSHIGAPLVGDPVYTRLRGIKAHGSGPAFDHATMLARKFERQALHAAVLGFGHPVTGEDLRFETKPPEDMAELIAALKAMPA